MAAILVLAFLPLMHDPLLIWPFVLAVSSLIHPSSLHQALLTFIAAAGVWRMFSCIDDERS